MSTDPKALAADVFAGLDPVRILEAAGIVPDEWQKRLLCSGERQILLNCSRQAGKSTAVAALALHTALFRAPSLVLLLSPSLRQSVELFRKVMDCYRAIDTAFKAITDSQTRIEFTNQSRIVCLPGKEDTIRSFSGVALLIIDEAARVPDDLYRSVRPMLAVSQGRLICLSTPFGKRGFFWQEWEDRTAPWDRIRITWRECPRITPAFIADEVRALGRSWVAQEYECSFEALEGLVYPDFEERCAVEACPFLPASLTLPHQGGGTQLIHPHPAGGSGWVGGIDFGFRNPFAAVWGKIDRDGTLWIFGEHYERERSIIEHARALPPRVLWHADPAGAQEIATLRRLDFAVRRANNDIQAGIAAIRARLETGRLKVLRSRCPNLLAEARLYRYPTQLDGQPLSEVPLDQDNHALAALRYLVSRTDDAFIKKFRRSSQTPDGPLETGETPADVRGREPRRWLRYDNEELWTPLN